MKIYNGFLAGVAIAALAACSSDNEPATDMTTGSNAIEVGTYISGTRAVDKTAFADGDVLSLYSCKTTGDYGNSFSANFMDNVKVTRGAAGDWTYSPLMAWPTDENEHLSFIAYYPQNTGSSATSYSFTVNENYAEQTDPLWCTIKDARINDRNGTAVNGSESDAAFEATSGALNLKFKHMLSKVNVKVKLASNYPGITCKLNDLTLCGVNKSGTFTINNDLSGGTWSSNTSTNFTLCKDDASVLSSTALNVAEMLMIPQEMSDNNSYFDIKYTHTLAEGGEKTVTKKIYLPNKWEVGKVYNYVINLSLDVNTISLSTEINNWDATENPNVGTKAAEAVDLGLSVKWASYDFGTVSPYDDGPKYDFYTNQDFSLADTWGANWRVPTYEEWNELVNNCTITSTIVNGKKIHIVEGKNGNKIYLPGEFYWTPLFSRGGYYAVRFYDSEGVIDNGFLISETFTWMSDSNEYPIRPVYSK